MEVETKVSPFAVRFGETLSSEKSFIGKDGVLLVEMSNATHLGQEGDEAC